jgi:hypothetical protein
MIHAEQRWFKGEGGLGDRGMYEEGSGEEFEREGGQVESGNCV